MSKPDLDLALVGNCTWGGLVDRCGRVVWACMPRFDSDPVFCGLLQAADPEDGTFAIELEGFEESQQSYVRNTAVLKTVLRSRNGHAVEICDFAPRYKSRGRMFRPAMLIRRIRPLAGEPRIRIVLKPRSGYGANAPTTTRGSNHIRFVMPDLTLRLTTDVPVSYVKDATPFVLQREMALVLGPDETFASALEPTVRDFENRTSEEWVEWCRALSVPFEWQESVIRAAIALKLCSFEETGAVVAALTTSIPEASGTERTWDYRYCWLRDAAFVIHALNRLGATRTMEGYLGYLTNLLAGADGHLQPVYGIGLESELPERVETSLKGYRGMGPVRVGNQAFEHTQNDVYGSAVLAATQSFFDQRLRHPGGPQLFQVLERVGASAAACWNQPDAGIWEYRGRAQVHTFSSVMCWAACDRLAQIARHLGISEAAGRWSKQAAEMKAEIVARAWSPSHNCFTEAFGNQALDASLLLLPEIGFIDADDPRFLGTLAAIESDLRRGDYIMRYIDSDDFGVPQNAFNSCTFWYIDALVAVGRIEEARSLFANMLSHCTRTGLLSEHLDPKSGELWGNFPQTYSMVGLINSAMRLSISWDEAF